MELKLKKAGRLLDTTELPIAMISSSLGFEDQMDFSKTFRKKVWDVSVCLSTGEASYDAVKRIDEISSIRKRRR